MSTLQQLEHVKSNMPEEGASRRLLDSASSFTVSTKVVHPLWMSKNENAQISLKF